MIEWFALALSILALLLAIFALAPAWWADQILDAADYLWHECFKPLYVEVKFTIKHPIKQLQSIWRNLCDFIR